MIKIITILMLSARFSCSASGTLDTGRSVEAVSDAWMVSMECQGDMAIARTAGHKFVITPTELKIDGKLYATIDESVKDVVVKVEGLKIELIADGEVVAERHR